MERHTSRNPQPPPLEILVRPKATRGEGAGPVRDMHSTGASGYAWVQYLVTFHTVTTDINIESLILCMHCSMLRDTHQNST